MFELDGESVDYSPPKLMVLMEYMKVRFEAFIYSRTAVDIAVPQLFAGIATAILIIKLLGLYIECLV